MISTGEYWKPSDLESAEMPDEVKIKLAKSDLQRSLKTLLSNGYTIEDITNGFLSIT